MTSKVMRPRTTAAINANALNAAIVEYLESDYSPLSGFTMGNIRTAVSRMLELERAERLEQQPRRSSKAAVPVRR